MWQPLTLNVWLEYGVSSSIPHGIHMHNIGIICLDHTHDARQVTNPNWHWSSETKIILEPAGQRQAMRWR